MEAAVCLSCSCDGQRQIDLDIRKEEAGSLVDKGGRMAHHVGGCPGREMGVDRRSRRVAEGRTADVPASRLRRSFWTAPHRILRTNRGRNYSRWHFGGDIPPNCARDVHPVPSAVVVETIRLVGKDRLRREGRVEGQERTTLTSPSRHHQVKEAGVDSMIPNSL